VSGSDELEQAASTPVPLPRPPPSFARQRLTARLPLAPAPHSALKAHPFFASLSWDAMLAQTVAAPFVPEMEDEFDASNFQEFDSDDEEETQPFKEDGLNAFEGF
jgi:hypothetical protein